MALAVVCRLPPTSRSGTLTVRRVEIGVSPGFESALLDQQGASLEAGRRRVFLSCCVMIAMDMASIGRRRRLQKVLFVLVVPSFLKLPGRFRRCRNRGTTGEQAVLDDERMHRFLQ
jgi:hypothetical protein